jgi:hypothetical protein
MPDKPTTHVPTPGQLSEGSAPVFYDNRAAVVAVTVLGVLVVAVPMPTVVGSIHASLAGQNTAVVGIEGIFGFAYVLLGVGLIIRREIARQVLVWVLSFGLALMCIGLFRASADGSHSAGFLVRAGVQLVPIVFLSHSSIKRVFS